MSTDAEEPESVSLADAFRFCPRCATPADETGVNPYRCRNCGFTLYFSPVTGVVCVIEDRAGRIVMFERNRPPRQGYLGLPGGFVDPGESASDAAVREVWEEVGLHVSRLNYIGSYPNTYPYRGVVIPVTDIIYHCEVTNLDEVAATSPEIGRMHVCHPGADELARMAFESNRRGLELFLQARAQRS